MMDATNQSTSPSRRPTLPNEIKLLIVGELGTLNHPQAFSYPRPSHRALLALALTNKAFRQWVTPILFRHITVSTHQVKRLLHTLCLYRPPYKTSVPQILSLRVIQDPSHHPGKGPQTALWHEELHHVVELASPTLKQICLPTATDPRISHLLSQMNSLNTSIIKPQNTLPKLSPYIQKLALYTNKLEAGIITPTYNEYLDALAPANNLQQIVIAEANLAYSVERHAWLIMALAQHFEHLSSIVVVPWASIFQPTANRSLRWLVNHLEPAGADAALVLRLRALVKYARVPLDVVDVGVWLMQRFDDGSAWDLDTVPYYDLHGLFHPVLRPPRAPTNKNLPIPGRE